MFPQPPFRLLIIFMIAIVCSLAGSAHAGQDIRVNTDDDGLAIKGYDPVAYFTLGEPTLGKAEFEHVWQDSRWWFASAEHRDRFQSDPERYAPRYGGFCAGGMALGRIWDVDPEAWVIVDDRLYLNWSKDGRDEFAADPEPHIAQADANWERLGKPE